MAAKKHPARIRAMETISDHTMLLTLEVGELPPVGGGRYIIVDTGFTPPGGKKVLKKAFTVLRHEVETGTLELGIRLLPDGGTRAWLDRAQPGDELVFGGPYGRFLPGEDLPADSWYTLVASDAGINSLLALLNDPLFVPRLPRCRVFWLVCPDEPYLSETLVRGRLPAETGHFERLELAPVGDARRPQQALTLLRSRCRRDINGPAWLAGDGDVMGPVKKFMISLGKLEHHVFTEFYFHKPKNPDGHQKGMREGFTTGACSAAAARAATRAMLQGSNPEEIETVLPNGREVTFAVYRCSREGEGATASIIKDAGDDPDVTHGAELVATVKPRRDGTGVRITGGRGVARVTRPGLGLEVGTAAINPVPRQNITDMVNLELAGSGLPGIDVCISVPDGEERAKHTLNPRLGLLGGISILGTTGIVKPYSTAAWIASVVKEIEVAVTAGNRELVFTTGGRTEAYAMKMLPRLSEHCFIQVGDYIGIGIRNALRREVGTIHIVGMMGKLSKMADNKMMTHASASEVNMELLAELAAGCGAGEETVRQVRAANTARHVLELCEKSQVGGMPLAVCRRAEAACRSFARGPVRFQITMVDFKGGVLARYTTPAGGEEEQES